ncbi:MAG: aminopeptidase P family protein [Paracoccaceae bacterium]
MFQQFEMTAEPDQGASRLAALRRAIHDAGLQGFFVPRADAHQGEYVAPADERLAWLTGFTGSAGFCIALAEIAGVFVDGRYRTQVKAQVDLAAFTPVPWPELMPGDWLRDQLPKGGRIGFDPWLHSRKEIEALTAALDGSGITLGPCPNLVDKVWPDRPQPPAGKIAVQPIAYAGETSAAKRARLGADLAAAGQGSAVITLPDSISWLLNIRGSDIARNPVVQAMGLLHKSGEMDLCVDPAKLSAEVIAHLGPDVRLHPPQDLLALLRKTPAPVRVDRATAPFLISAELSAAGVETVWGQDPCILPKACKNATEIAGATAAHLRDAAAMAEFLAWFDQEAPKGDLTEIDVVTALEGFRQATGALKEISFETICGAGPNGAIIHYRVTKASNRRLQPGEIVVLDSGGQYLDGTTDITRTLPVGDVGAEERQAFTRVLQGMIAISRLRFPKGLAGQHIDAIARQNLWRAGLDYDHGTGHGVGVYLSVHEGPAGISRRSEVPLEPGMILSNEPGYYREGAFGIRIENLLVVEEAPALTGGDAGRAMLSMRTLTAVPIDKRLIVTELLTADEITWINQYHAGILQKIGPKLSAPALSWLTKACAPLA